MTTFSQCDDNMDTDQWDLPFLDSEFKIDDEDMLKLLRGLDVNKAVGLYNISAKMHAQNDCFTL